MRALLRIAATVGLPLVALLAPAPAFPAAGATFTLTVSDVTVPDNQQEATVGVRLAGPAGRYGGASLIIDTRPLAGIVTLADPGDVGSCAKADGVWTCPVPDGITLRDNSFTEITELWLTSTAAATPGTRATFRTTVAATGLPTLTAETVVTIGADVRLRTDEAQALIQAHPGDPIDYPVPLGNIGAHPSQGAVLHIRTWYEVAPAVLYRNCWYADAPESPLMEITCVFDTPIMPGVLSVARPAFQVRPDAIGADVDTWAQWETPTEAAQHGQAPGSRGTQGTGPLLILQPYAGPISNMQSGRQIRVRVTGAMPVDLAPVGTTVTGRVGQVVTTRLGIGNVGRVTFDSGLFNGERLYLLVVAVPPGTTVTAKPEGCHFVRSEDLGRTSPYSGYAPAYWCEPTGFIRAGTTVWLPFSLRLDRAGTSTTRIRLIDAWPELFRDGNPANNTAPLTVTATGASGGTGGGDSGLPITGGPTGRLAAAGAVFVLAGLGVLAATRRRRRGT